MVENQKDPAVTIVIPAYNHERFVGEAVESVLHQTFGDWELIVIDDGSTDATGTIVDRYSSGDQVQVIHRQNAGLSATLNKGLDMARGRYFGFLPSDDMFLPEKLDLQIEWMEARPGIAAVASHQTLIDGEGRPIVEHPLVEWFNVTPSGREDLLLGLLERNFISAPSVLARTEVLRSVGGFDPHCIYMQDYDMWLRLLKDHQMEVLPRPLVSYRWHGENLTRTATDASETERARILRRIADLWEPSAIFPSLRGNPRPEIVARCRIRIHEALRRNRTTNFEEIQYVFDQKLRHIFKESLQRHPVEKTEISCPPAPHAGASPRSLSILLEVPSLDRGGLEQVVHDLARGLRSLGHRIAVVCTERGGEIARRLESEGDAAVEILPGEGREAAYREILQRHAVDLVNAHYSFFGTRLAAEAGVPVVSVVHNIYAWLPGDVLGAFRTLDPLVSHYVAVSNDVAAFMASHFKIDPDRITVIPNGLDLELWRRRKKHGPAADRNAFGLKSGDIVFLTVAAINRTKGQDRIVRVFPELLEDVPNARAVFLGPVMDETFLRHLRRLIAEAGIEDKIVFVPHAADAGPYYKMADVFVLPSVVEGWSLAMMEAMFFGLPLIMTDVAGARIALKDEPAAVLLPPPFPELSGLDPQYQEHFTMMAEDPMLPDLLDAMRRFCARPREWRAAAKSLEDKVVNRYSMDRSLQAYEKNFLHVVAHSRMRSLEEARRNISAARQEINRQERQLTKVSEALNISQTTLDKLIDYAYTAAKLGHLNIELERKNKEIQELKETKKNLESTIIDIKTKSLKEINNLTDRNRQLQIDISAWNDQVQTIYNSKAWRAITAYRKKREQLRAIPKRMGQGLHGVTRRIGRKIIVGWGVDVPEIHRKFQASAARVAGRFRELGAAKDEAASRTVSICTPSFFDRAGNNMFFGGAERYLIDLARLIRDRGYDVQIYQPGDFPWVRYYRDIKVQGFPCGTGLEEMGRTFDALAPPARLAIYHAFYLAADSHARTGPAIGISHGNYWDTSSFQFSRENFDRHVTRILDSIRKVDTLVCVDTNTINWLRAIDYNLSPKAEYIPNYADLEQFKQTDEPEGDDIVICFPRRLYKPRGFYLFIENVDFLLARYAQVRIHFVGKGDKKELDMVGRLVEESGGRVQLYNCPPEKMHEVYQRSHIILIPTVSSEGTSFSCLEAMACGRAVVATNVGGLPNLIIDGYNGRLIPPTAEALRDALVQLIESKELRLRFGKRARQVVEEAYSKAGWETRWHRILDRSLPREEEAGQRARTPAFVYPHTPPIRWSLMQQRPQQICRHMAEAGIPVFFYSDNPDDRRHSSGNLQILRPGDDLYLDSPVVYIHYPFHFPKIKEYSDPIVLYDILDDISIYSGAMLEEAAGYHRRLVEDADIVVCSSHRLLDKLKRERTDAVLVPNAVRPDDFETPDPSIPEDLAPLVEKGRPVVGYVGAFGDWFDFELYNAVTLGLPEYSFVLIGPDYMENVGKITRRDNVRWLGPKPYEDLPRYYARFSVGIIPFVLSEVTHSTSPLKLFEYMANRKPVVTTAMDECRRIPGVYTASSAEEFASRLREAVAGGGSPEYQATIARVVQENTWAARAEVLKGLIEQARQEREAGVRKGP